MNINKGKINVEDSLQNTKFVRYYLTLTTIPNIDKPSVFLFNIFLMFIFVQVM
jgi:hypothetical protein